MTSTKTEQILRKISVEEFGEFLNDKNIDPKCPECKVGESGINTYHDEVGIMNYPLAMINENSEIIPVKSISLPAFSITCSNCGYIRSYSAAVVQKWIKSEGKKET